MPLCNPVQFDMKIFALHIGHRCTIKQASTCSLHDKNSETQKLINYQFYDFLNLNMHCIAMQHNLIWLINKCPMLQQQQHISMCLWVNIQFRLQRQTFSSEIKYFAIIQWWEIMAQGDGTAHRSYLSSTHLTLIKAHHEHSSARAQSFNSKLSLPIEPCIIGSAWA
jgi:hypothetical protein